MNWLTKLERKFGRYCIPNLIALLVGGQIVVYAVELFVNRYITYFLALNRPALFSGEIWRLVTFLFVPFSSGNILNFALEAYFIWFIGSALEAVWGDFRFNLYILAGMLGAILACLITGWADTYCLSLSLLLAFALLYPDQGEVFRHLCGGGLGAQLFVGGLDDQTELPAEHGGVHFVLCAGALFQHPGLVPAGAVAPAEPPLRGAAP